MRQSNRIARVATLAVLALGALASAAVGAEVATVDMAPFHVTWTPVSAEPVAGILLVVAGPDGFRFERTFAAGEAPGLAVDGAWGRLADGPYSWELRVLPALSPEVRATLEATRAEDGTQSPGAPAGPRGATQAGHFTVADGAILDPTLIEPASAAPGASTAAPVAGPGDRRDDIDRAVAGATEAPEATVLTNADGVIRQSLCTGIDCPDSPSFSDTTMLLMENNTRIKFDDTSVSAGFPNRDWQLRANDQASGGANVFVLQDCGVSSQGGCGGNSVLSVEGGAPNNAVFVDDTGRLGLRTSTPVLDIHARTGNTPALRLEQDGSSGFTPQTWDVAGNEAGFFVRDATGGSTLPFRIRPGAASNSLVIDGDGEVGVGTLSPQEQLHVTGSDGSNRILVEETSGTAALRNMFTMRNNGGIQLLYDRTDGTSNDWQMSNFNATFQISVPGSSPAQFNLNANGNLTIGGTNYNTGSSRSLKTAFAPVDGVQILERLVAMPLTSWSPLAAPEERHIGPVAEDWWQTFGLGTDDRHVGMTDVGGVALAAIRGLNEIVEEKDAAIRELQAVVAALERQNGDLGDRLTTLERLVAEAAEPGER